MKYRLLSACAVVLAANFDAATAAAGERGYREAWLIAGRHVAAIRQRRCRGQNTAAVLVLGQRFPREGSLLDTQVDGF